MQPIYKHDGNKFLRYTGTFRGIAISNFYTANAFPSILVPISIPIPVRDVGTSPSDFFPIS